jgi:hypothetical protein
VTPEAAPKKANIIKQGFLIKEGGGYKTWLERYFVLTDDGLLAYYTSDKVDVKQLFEKRGKLKVPGAKLQEWERGVVPVRDGYLFAITSTSKQSRQYIMEAKTFEDRDAWINTLKANGATWDGVKPMTKFNQNSILEGWLTKQGGRIKTWRRRYFVLLKGSSANTLDLQYWKATTEKKMQDNIPLTNQSVLERDNKHNTIAIKVSQTSDRRYLITAYDARVREAWMQALCVGLGQDYKPGPLVDEKKGGSTPNSPVQPSRSSIASNSSNLSSPNSANSNTSAPNSPQTSQKTIDQGQPKSPQSQNGQLAVPTS